MLNFGIDEFVNPRLRDSGGRKVKTAGGVGADAGRLHAGRRDGTCRAKCVDRVDRRWKHADQLGTKG